MKKNVNSSAFAALATIVIFMAVFIIVIARTTRDKDKKTESSKKQTSALHVATPEALDPAYYVNGSKVMAEDLSYAENEELLENL
jgi:hypothetical protein